MSDKESSVETWTTPPDIADFLDEHRAELVAFRRHLHSFPELSGEESATTELIFERLELAGLSPHILSSGTGLWCDVGSGDRCVALRADIDGLAMDDTKTAHYRSRVPGVAHGCGHDMHSAIVLGAGLHLARDENVGRVRLIFEPSEETVPGGAVTVIGDRLLEGVDTILGVHCDPKLDVGVVGLRSGALTSAADMVEITLSGPGGHTARPHLTVDLVSLAGRIASELPSTIADITDGALSQVFGSIVSGHAANVIPSSAVLRGGVRTPDRELWKEAEGIVSGALVGLLAGSGAEHSIDYTDGVPPVVNDPEIVSIMSRVVRELGPDALVEAPRSMGGDSFAWYLEHVPGCYARLGVHDPAWGETRLDLHSGSFDVDERSLDVGITLLVGAAIAALEGS